MKFPSTELVRRWQTLPMRDWPSQAFEDLGLKSPYAPNNLTIRREALEHTEHLTRGDIVECGVYRGQSLASLAWWLREVSDPRIAWGFDSFAGFAPASGEDETDGFVPPFSQPHYYADTSLETVKRFMDALNLYDRVRLVEGFFDETLASPPVERISVLILDCDLYAAYRTCLSQLYERVLSGGWIILDEYFSPKYPGARIAVDKFFEDKPEKVRLATHMLAEHPYERWYVIKE